MYRYQGECFVYKKIILTAISFLLLFTLGGCSPSAAPKEPRLFGFTAMDMTDQSFRLALAELEELVNQGKIIRPAYKYVGTHKQFEDIDER